MTQLLEAPVETGIDFDELVRATRPARLKLSAAIRQGALLTRPGQGLWEKEEYGEVYACAMGAACYAAAGNRASGVQHASDAARYFPELDDQVTITETLVPEYRRIMRTIPAEEPVVVRWALSDHIMLLNDEADVTRERIADIVEALGY